MFLAARLSIGAKILLSASAPEDAAGEFVIRLAVVLIVHLLGTKMPAGKRKVMGGFRIFHGNSLRWRAGRSHGRPFPGRPNQLDFIRISTQGLGALDCSFGALRRR